MSEIVHDHLHREAFLVRTGPTEQSWVDLDDPLRIEFEYVQRIVELLELTLLSGPSEPLPRIVHIGGGGLSIPRYLEARRPGCRQIVLEPDADLVDEVRRRLPLPRRSGIKVRVTDGRSGLADLAAASADAVVVDAFDRAQVPGDLATLEFFSALADIARPTGLVVMNVGDKGPFDWSRRCVAALRAAFPHIGAMAEGSVWKGRRYGNLVLAASKARIPFDAWQQAAARVTLGNHVRRGPELQSWIGRAAPFTDGDTRHSLDPVALGWLT